MALRNNVLSTLNVLEGVRAEAPHSRVLTAGSGETYGAVPEERLPVGEEEQLHPQSPYAVSKASGEMLAGLYASAHGMHVVRARPFNHIGPGQSDAFAIGSFARQIARAELTQSGQPAILRAGSLEVRRDFTDVRDVVRAYWLLLERAPPGVYNVCSGRSVALREMVDALVERSATPIRLEHDPSLVRTEELPESRGSFDRLVGATGWRPEIPLAQTLDDTLGWWRERLREEGLT